MQATYVMGSMRRFNFITTFAAISLAAYATPDMAVDFETEIRPLLAERCFECHGPDQQKSGLRLDDRAAAFLGGDSGKAIVPGNAAESLLVKLVSGAEPNRQMPAKGELLSEPQIAAIKAWIDEGANWPDEVADGAKPGGDHWAFQPIGAPAPPAIDDAWVRNDIDRFVLAKLQEKGLAPSPEADRVTLIRRLHLDLLGLPPTPAEVDAFVNDPSPYAYEKLVNRLLASPHFGERWGRHWLDLARYADSDGYEKDNVRPHAWRYREWVINAFNRDLPYDQFVIEQLAGDLLPNPTTEQLVATGFNRNTLTNKEGGIDPEEDRVKQTVDRTNTVGNVFLGLTMACAECHSHKYDPITQREYYGMYAFFNAAAEKDVPAPLDAEAALHSREMAQWESRYNDLRKQVNEQRAELRKRLPEWETQMQEKLGELKWTLLEPASMMSSGGATLEQLDDGSILVSGNSPAIDTYTVVVPTDLKNISAFRLEVLTHESLPNTGPGRARHGNFILSELDIETVPLTNTTAPEPVKIASAWADFWEDGWPIEAALDDDKTTGWSANAWQGYNENRAAVFIAEDDIGLEDGTTLRFTFDHQRGTSHAMGRFRLYAAQGSREHVLIAPEAIIALNTPEADRTAEQRGALMNHFEKDDPAMRALHAALEAHEKLKPNLNSTLAQILVRNSEPPDTHIHVRGNFMQKGDEVRPHTPAILPPMQHESDSPTRLDLATWIVQPDNPLTPRVAANRVWERLFGQGLVLTSEDFGTRGEQPSHPELLDWLATELMKNGWSRKELIRLIVSSATYRQSSVHRPEVLALDAQNRLLSRQNRFRVHAEVVRDLFLAASGLLNPTVGGPSVRPPLPEGVAELGYANSVKWPESTGADKYRRGIYIHFQRTVPYPMLMTFDCPDSNTTAIRRARSNTPLQALTLMNDPVFFECAQVLGAKVYQEAPQELEARLTYLFRIALGREPLPEERAALLAFYDAEYEEINKDGDLATRIVGGYLPEGAQPQEVAPWITVARAVLNLDEFVTRE